VGRCRFDRREARILVEYIWSFRGALLIHTSIYIYGSRLGYVIGLLLCMSTVPDQVGYDLPHPKCPDSSTDLSAPPKRNCPDPTDIMGILDQNLSGRTNQPRHLYSGVLFGCDGLECDSDPCATQRPTQRKRHLEVAATRISRSESYRACKNCMNRGRHSWIARGQLGGNNLHNLKGCRTRLS